MINSVHVIILIYVAKSKKSKMVIEMLSVQYKYSNVINTTVSIIQILKYTVSEIEILKFILYKF